MLENHWIAGPEEPWKLLADIVQLCLKLGRQVWRDFIQDLGVLAK
jgi:hypothetical protein